MRDPSDIQTQEPEAPFQEVKGSNGNGKPRRRGEPERPKKDESVEPAIKFWTSRILRAKERFKDDFTRMAENMNFVKGLQWAAQTSIDKDDRYVANITLHQIEQKVAQLYAKDPRVRAKRKSRLDFKMWDGKMESLKAAVSMNPATTAPESQAAGLMVLSDYAQGRQVRDMLDRVGKTLEVAFGWTIDNQQPSFKRQMKQLVRTVCTCGVAFLALEFVRGGQGTIAPTDVESTIQERMGRILTILRKVKDNKVTLESPELETLKQLVEGIDRDTSSGDVENMNERLVYLFPSPTSVIVDPDCTSLSGFIGAEWIAWEFVMDVDEVNSYYGSEVKAEGETTTIPRAGEANVPPSKSETKIPERVRIWKVWNIATKSQFVICQGYKEWLEAPHPVSPDTNHFWPIYALSFNETVVDPNDEKCKVSIYPVSDVDLLRHPQKEWNRSHDSLRNQRKANEPMYFSKKKALSDDDKKKVEAHVPNTVIELEGGGDDAPIDSLIVPRKPAPIDPMAYDLSPIVQDLYFVLGAQPMPQGRGSNKATATAATIVEQQRISLAQSNIDDLDTFLSEVARGGGEMLLKEMSKETITRIVGVGAVWTDDFQNREDFVNLLYLDIVAGSSGRPNKSLEIANWQVLMPLLAQAGAPATFLIEETLKRLDESLTIDDVFPGGVPMMLPQQGMTPSPERTQRPQLSNNGQEGAGTQNTFPTGTQPQPPG